MPAVFGVAVLSKEIVLIIANESFIAASPAIIISAVTMFVCLGAYFWGQAILVPFKKENVVLRATITRMIVRFDAVSAVESVFGKVKVTYG